jgi:hypothetical protein
LNAPTKYPVASGRGDGPQAKIGVRRIETDLLGIVGAARGPKRYLEILNILRPTAWVGCSVAQKEYIKTAESVFCQIDGVPIKFLMIEPILQDFDIDLGLWDWIIMGAQTETKQPDGIVPALPPPFEWVARKIFDGWKAGCKVFCKSNLLGDVHPQSPGMVLPREVPKK